MVLLQSRNLLKLIDLVAVLQGADQIDLITVCSSALVYLCEQCQGVENTRQE